MLFWEQSEEPVHKVESIIKNLCCNGVTLVPLPEKILNVLELSS
jgi:hypothetical protein